MKIQVLISTMNQEDITQLVKDMSVNNAVVINQITKNITKPKEIRNNSLKSFSVKERGLSKSRNRAIQNASADICLIADDDMYYVDKYEDIVNKAYSAYPDADILCFYVDHEDTKLSNNMQRAGRLSLLETMKISSCQISFRRLSIIKNELRMDSRFGAGTENYMGEENIFLFDAYHKGLKIYHVPVKIATLKCDSTSTWFTGYNRKFFEVKGMAFYRMSRFLAPILIAQFVIRKRGLYKSNMTMHAAGGYMIRGMLKEIQHEK